MHTSPRPQTLFVRNEVGPVWPHFRRTHFMNYCSYCIDISITVRKAGRRKEGLKEGRKRGREQYGRKMGESRQLSRDCLPCGSSTSFLSVLLRIRSWTSYKRGPCVISIGRRGPFVISIGKRGPFVISIGKRGPFVISHRRRLGGS